MEKQKFIFFAQRPEITKLCHVVLKVLASQSAGIQIQILKCRQLLCLSRDVLAYPREDDRTIIDAVVSVDFYKTSMAALCSKLQLKPLHASIAKNFPFEQCLRYTVKFRLSAQWAHAGDLFLNDVKFLTSNSKMEAVRAEINISDKDIVFQLQPSLVRLPQSRLEDFAICPDVIEKFQSDVGYSIPEVAINLSWCHILPSMRKGQLVSVFRNLKPSQAADGTALLKDYAGIRKYWKTHYGYQLPEEDGSQIYCSIYFMRIPHQLFTYPLGCVRNKNFQFLPRCDGPSIIENFFSHIRHKLEKICGIAVNYVSNNPATLQTNLTTALHVKPEKLSNTKLIKLPPKTEKAVPKYSKEDSDKSFEDRQVPDSSQDVIFATQRTHAEQQVPSSSISKALAKMPKTREGKIIPTFQARKMTVNNISSSASVTNKTKLKSKTLEQRGNIVIKEKPLKATAASSSWVKEVKKKTDLVTSKENAAPKSSAKRKYTKTNAAAKPPTQTKKQKHNFDELFAPASVNKPTAKTPSAQKKKHNFDNLFATASVNKPTAKTPSAQKKKHNFDNLFATASVNKPTAKTPSAQKKKHNFDNLFATANVNKTTAKTPSAQKKKHNFDELFTPAKDVPNRNTAVAGTKPTKVNISSKPCKTKPGLFDQLFSSASQCNNTEKQPVTKKPCLFDQLFASAGNA